MMILRRTGWRTRSSASVVVNPHPVKADRAWNRAISIDSPASTNAVGTMRIITGASTSTTRSETMETMSLLVVEVHNNGLTSLPNCDAHCSKRERFRQVARSSSRDSSMHWYW